MTALQYYKWLHSVERLNHEKTAKILTEMKLRLIKKAVEADQLRINLASYIIEESSRKVAEAESDYQILKKEIEADLGTSLNNKAINESFEVIDLEKEK